ncbi:MAG: sodium:solute symporter family protein [Roseivirga sp.]
MAPPIFDHCVVGIFLFVTLYVGLQSGRGITNIRSYAIADKRYGTGTLVLTFMATNFAGASLVNGVAQVHYGGIITSVALSGLIIMYLISAFFIAPKVAAFDHCLTMGDLMEHLYDKHSKIIAGMLGLLTAVCIASMEMIVLGIIFESLLGVSASWGVVIGGITLAIYSSRGGIQAVTTTDVLQFIVLIVAIPLTATIAIGHVGGFQALFTQVPVDKFEVLNHERFSYYFTLFLTWSILPAGMIDPAIIQRLLMGKEPGQLRRQYLIIAALHPTLELVILLIGLAGIVLYPKLEATQVFPHIVHELLPVGIKGLVIAGALAVSMSTIDSYLHAAGLTLTHDVLKPLCDMRKVVIDELTWAKYSTLVLGLMAVLVGTLGAGANTDQILGFAFTALGFTGPLLMFPLLSGIMGLKTDTRSFYTALPMTLAAFVLSNVYLPPEQDHLSLLISILANGVTFFGMHAWQNKGFAVTTHGVDQQETTSK